MPYFFCSLLSGTVFPVHASDVLLSQNLRDSFIHVSFGSGCSVHKLSWGIVKLYI